MQSAKNPETTISILKTVISDLERAMHDFDSAEVEDDYCYAWRSRIEFLYISIKECVRAMEAQRLD